MENNYSVFQRIKLSYRIIIIQTAIKFGYMRRH